MSAREDKIRRVVAELDVHIAEVEANVAVLKALLADDESRARKTPVDPEARLGQRANARDAPSFPLLHSRTRAGHPSMRLRAAPQPLGRRPADMPAREDYGLGQGLA